MALSGCQEEPHHPRVQHIPTTWRAEMAQPALLTTRRAKLRAERRGAEGTEGVLVPVGSIPAPPRSSPRRRTEEVLPEHLPAGGQERTALHRLLSLVHTWRPGGEETSSPCRCAQGPGPRGWWVTQQTPPGTHSVPNPSGAPGNLSSMRGLSTSSNCPHLGTPGPLGSPGELGRGSSHWRRARTPRL